jgi:integrase
MALLGIINTTGSAFRQTECDPSVIDVPPSASPHVARAINTARKLIAGATSENTRRGRYGRGDARADHGRDGAPRSEVAAPLHPGASCSTTPRYPSSWAVKPAARIAGISEVPVSPHLLRDSHGTHALRRGANLATRARHHGACVDRDHQPLSARPAREIQRQLSCRLTK